MSEESKYDNRQSILLFIAGVAMCAAFFVFGLLVGRWSAGDSDRPLLDASSNLPATGSLSVGASASSGSTRPGNVGPSSSGRASTSSELAGDSSGSEEPTAPERPALGQPPGEPRAYVVRAARFTKSDDAATFAGTLRSRGFGNAHTRLESGARRSFSVILGPYANREEASKVVVELRNSGVSNVQIISER